ncbi:MAG: hypothetical protein CL885_03140 [Dehalococcoidia bacterium]|nr:hypothetical protein [Dehalococcoidia bacterium]
MKEEDKNKITVALANSYLQNVTLQQALLIVQEKSLERAREEVEGMTEEAQQELLTNVRAQEIAQDLREKEGEGASEEAEETETETETAE